MRGNIIRRGRWASVDFMKNEMVRTRTTNSNWSERIKQRFTQASASETSDWTADTVSFADEAQQNAQAKSVDRLFSQLNAFNILNVLVIIFYFFATNKYGDRTRKTIQSFISYFWFIDCVITTYSIIQAASKQPFDSIMFINGMFVWAHDMLVENGLQLTLLPIIQLHIAEREMQWQQQQMQNSEQKFSATMINICIQ